MSQSDTPNEQIHQQEQILSTGASIEEADVAMILVHGRGASAQDILGLSSQLTATGMVYIAPQAAGHTWYPYSFLEPIEQNEPYLTSALQRMAELVAMLEDAGIPAERTILAGFSQGACLISEFAARNARRYGGLVAFSGGVIGPPGTPRDYDGSLDGTPAFLGCSDIDPHIPVERVHETDEVLRNLGASVTTQIYPGMGHTINRDELAQAQRIVDGLSPL
ncbi:MAG: alpha/beta hydrolase [Chloroflexota bacterium]